MITVVAMEDQNTDFKQEEENGAGGTFQSI